VLRVFVLGSVAVTRDGEPVAVPGGRTTELLVRLALDAGAPVRADRLIEDLWAVDAVNTRRNTLQSKVARLRRALGAEAVVAGLDGYRLAVAPAAVDALALADLAAEAAARHAGGDHAGAAEHGARALAGARGELLPGAGDADWAAPPSGCGRC
jgi:DNA-binding SARP family transcriptional activator